jgi:hypothetical protein
MGAAFRGFIVGLWRNGRLHRFATYTGAKTTALEISSTQVTWRLQSRYEELRLIGQRAESGLLRGPTRLDMGKRVDETLSAGVEVSLRRRGASEIFHGFGRYAGLEVHGDLSRLQNMR